MRRTLFFPIALLLVSGCGDESTTPADYFVPYQLSVERIEVPTAVAAGDSLCVSLYGIIGPDALHWFDHMESVETESLFSLTAWGIRDETPDHGALPAMIEWQGAEFWKGPPHTNPVRVVFNQPDGTTVEKSVSVVP